jgi:pyruvate dehydrogenase kinase 2/3/4
VRDYNARFTRVLESIKHRHDPTVTTVAQGVLEWKRSKAARHIGLDMQSWLDRFYLSRIGIRFLIGQRKSYASTIKSGMLISFNRHCLEPASVGP